MYASNAYFTVICIQRNVIGITLFVFYFLFLRGTLPEATFVPPAITAPLVLVIHSPAPQALSPPPEDWRELTGAHPVPLDCFVTGLQWQSFQMLSHVMLGKHACFFSFKSCTIRGIIHIFHLTVFIWPKEKVVIFDLFSFLKNENYLSHCLLQSGLTSFLESPFGFMPRIFAWIKGTSPVCQQDIRCSKIYRKPVYMQTRKSDE